MDSNCEGEKMSIFPRNKNVFLKAVNFIIKNVILSIPAWVYSIIAGALIGSALGILPQIFEDIQENGGIHFGLKLISLLILVLSGLSLEKIHLSVSTFELSLDDQLKKEKPEINEISEVTGRIKSKLLIDETREERKKIIKASQIFIILFILSCIFFYFTGLVHSRNKAIPEIKCQKETKFLQSTNEIKPPGIKPTSQAIFTDSCNLKQSLLHNDTSAHLNHGRWTNPNYSIKKSNSTK